GTVCPSTADSCSVSSPTSTGCGFARTTPRWPCRPARCPATTIAAFPGNTDSAESQRGGCDLRAVTRSPPMAPKRDAAHTLVPSPYGGPSCRSHCGWLPARGSARESSHTGTRTLLPAVLTSEVPPASPCSGLIVHRDCGRLPEPPPRGLRFVRSDCCTAAISLPA